MAAGRSAKIPLENEYRDWLAMTYSGRLLSDWVSRTRRVMTLIDFSELNSPNDVDIELLKSAEIAKLSMSVRSQLKKAGRMFVEFRNSRK